MRLVPEKTIELHTALAILGHLGHETSIWSYTSGIDQGVWSDNFRKFFMLELKAPEYLAGLFFEIDIKQLTTYVNNFNHNSHPDVLYVLPLTPFSLLHQFWGHWPTCELLDILYSLSWCSSYLRVTSNCPSCFSTIPYCNLCALYAHDRKSSLAAFRSNLQDPSGNAFRSLLHFAYSLPCVRQSFACHTYVIRASDLSDLLSSSKSLGRARIRWDGYNFTYRGCGLPLGQTAYSTPQLLCRFLQDIIHCNESQGLALRSHELSYDRSQPEDDRRHEDIFLEQGSISRAIRTAGEGHPKGLLFVGWPG